MKIVVIGGTGRVGSRSFSCSTNTDTMRLPLAQYRGEHHHRRRSGRSHGRHGRGGRRLQLAVARRRCRTGPSSNGDANLLDAERAAGVGHHVALSVVGTEDLGDGRGYFQAKLAQEELIAKSGIPYSIVHATQFFDFVGGIADQATDGDAVRLAPAYFQPMASADVAEAVAIAAVGAPLNGIREGGGPERSASTNSSGQRWPRTTIPARSSRIRRPVTGGPVGEYTLTPGEGATLFETRFEDWILEGAAAK